MNNSYVKAKALEQFSPEPSKQRISNYLVTTFGSFLCKPSKEIFEKRVLNWLQSLDLTYKLKPLELANGKLTIKWDCCLSTLRMRDKIEDSLRKLGLTPDETIWRYIEDNFGTQDPNIKNFQDGGEITLSGDNAKGFIEYMGFDPNKSEVYPEFASVGWSMSGYIKSFF